MTELIWEGKYKDGKKVTPVRIALPFQTIETVNESAQQRQKTLDFFAAIAFASVFGWGVAASALTILVFQGTLTALGYALGNFMTDVQVLMLSATGGLLILGISLRLLNIRQIPVGNMLPALVIAPLLVAIVA